MVKYNKDSVVAIVLAAGSGKRMGTSTKKQYLLLKNHPILYYTLQAFEESEVDEIVLVVGEDDMEYCNTEIVNKYKLKKVKTIIIGGRERYDSVYRGLSATTNCEYVLIHDGARPFITVDLINNCISDVKKYKAAIVGVPTKDTLRVISPNGTIKETLDRSLVWNIQTPQCFHYDLIKDAYDDLFDNYNDYMNKKDKSELTYQGIRNYTSDNITITDDAMVLELTKKYPIHVTMGDYRNIKVTTIEDLVLGEAFLNDKIKNEKN